MKPMTGFEALGYLLIETGNIVAIRHEYASGEFLTYKGLLERETLPAFPLTTLATSGWQIGFRCLDCCGTGESVDYDRHGNLVDCECPKCDGGIRWEREY